jgi:4'-phosphopantetheinyl transferase
VAYIRRADAREPMTAGQPQAAPVAWAPGPARPILGGGELHVWHADLRAVPVALQAALDAGERARAERIVDARRRARWAAGRALLRDLLGRHLGCDPGAVALVEGAQGKPALAADSASGARAAPPSFNLSHSGEHALCALAASGPVGVDIEAARRPLRAVELARRVLGAEEALRLQELEPGVRELEFRRAWVRHEARMKCLGVGVGAGDAQALERGRSLWVAQLEPALETPAAVAARERPRALMLWTWSGAGEPRDAARGAP